MEILSLQYFTITHKLDQSMITNLLYSSLFAIISYFIMDTSYPRIIHIRANLFVKSSKIATDLYLIQGDIYMMNYDACQGKCDAYE
jgi:hypothetical protein